MSQLYALCNQLRCSNAYCGSLITFYSLSFSLRTFSLVRIYGNSCQRSQLTLMGSTRTGRSVVCTGLEKGKPFPLLHHISSHLHYKQSLGRHENKALEIINKQSQTLETFLCKNAYTYLHLYIYQLNCLYNVVMYMYSNRLHLLHPLFQLIVK